MKYINKFYRKFISMESEKKQILFALFAFFFYVGYILITKKNVDINIIKSGAPAALVAAGKEIGKAALAGAAKGGAEGLANAGEDQSKLGAAVGGAARGAAEGAITKGTSMASSANSAKKVAESAKNTANAQQSIPKQPPKNVSTNPNGINNTDNLKAKPKEMDADTSSKAQKEAAKSETEKDSAKNKDKGLDVGKAKSEDDAETDMEEGTKSIRPKGIAGKFALGCAMASTLPFLIFVVLISAIISPNTTTISEIDCTDSDSAICEKSNEDTTFLEKITNFFKYGKFTATENVASEKAKDVYDFLYRNYEVGIDVPTLLASLFADSPMVRNETTGELEYNKEVDLENRVEYMQELAEMQIAAYEMSYSCGIHVGKDGGSYYSWDLDYLKKLEYKPGILAETKAKQKEQEQEDLPCDEQHDGATKSEYKFALDIEGFYDNIRKYPEVLGYVYGEDAISTENDLNRLINEIMQQTDLFKEAFSEDESYDSSGNSMIDGGDIPEDLLNDPSVDLQSPIKGSYETSSGYGYRTGEFSGFHSGIDLVSSDDTIYAAGKGVVIWAGNEEKGGNVIEILHTTESGDKYVTLYAHLSKFLVSTGDVVNSGDPIGIMGATGQVSGKHLHFEIRWDQERNVAFNPSDLF